MKTLKIVLIVGATLLTIPAHAFDGDRRGFVLGLGAGMHVIDIDFKQDGEALPSDDENGLATTFKIGWGISNQFSLYYVRNASWYRAPFYDGYSVSDATYAVGISGIGATYYLSPTAPSGYFIGAVGIGDASLPFEESVDMDTGNAAMIGMGFEVADHVQLEATLLRTRIDSGDYSGLKMNTSSIQFTASYLFY